MERVDEKSVERVIEILNSGGFSFTKGETNPAYEVKLKDYKRTPDLIEASFVGNGAPQDFVVDVMTPKGDLIWDLAKIQSYLNESWNNRKNFKVVQYPLDQKNVNGVVNSINGKADRYKRANSPLFGVVYYFDMRDTPINPLIIKTAPYKMTISWQILKYTTKGSFQKEFYFYMCILPLFDRMFGTGLLKTGDVSSKDWSNGITKVFDKLFLRKKINSFVQIPAKRMHGFCTFFLLLVDLPQNIQQMIYFYCINGSNNRRYKYVLNNNTFKHLSEMINGAKLISEESAKETEG